MKKRKCQKCGVIKPIDMFTKEPRIVSGYLWKCKECEMADDMMFVENVRRAEFRRKCR